MERVCGLFRESYFRTRGRYSRYSQYSRYVEYSRGEQPTGSQYEVCLRPDQVVLYCHVVTPLGATTCLVKVSEVGKLPKGDRMGPEWG